MNNLSKGKFWGWICVCGGTCALLIVFAWPRQKPVFMLPEGLLRLEGVTYGTNAFVDGNVLERAFSKYIPVRGINILGRRVNRAGTRYPAPIYKEPVITAWFRLQAPLQWSDLRGWSFIVQSENGRQLYCPSTFVQTSSASNTLSTLTLTAFPRDSRRLFLRVDSPRTTNSTTSSMPLFPVSNLNPVVIRDWEAKPLPVTNRLDGVDLVLDRASLSHGSFDGRPIPWSASIGFRPSSIVTSGKIDLTGDLIGKSKAAWEVTHCEISDCEGNRRAWTRRYGRDDRFDFDFGLESNRTWRVEATVVRSNNFPAEELSRFSVSSMQTATKITNQIEGAVECKFDGRELIVSKTGGWKDRPYLRITWARDGNGKSLRLLNGPSWRGTSGKVQSVHWSLEKSTSDAVEFELAFPKTIGTDFLVKPESGDVTAKY